MLEPDQIASSEGVPTRDPRQDILARRFISAGYFTKPTPDPRERRRDRSHPRWTREVLRLWFQKLGCACDWRNLVAGNRKMGNRLLRTFIIVSTLVLLPTRLYAQAWVPDRGTLGTTFDYNFFSSDKVVTDTTMTFENAGSTGHQFLVGVEYSPINKLAVTAALPILSIKYTGDQGPQYRHPGGGRYDDGSYHTTLTDLRAGARYQVLDDPVAIAPHLAFSVPVADYETVGNAVAGRGIKMAHLGVSAGYVIGLATYVHLTYEFSLGEKYDRTPDTARHSQNRSDLSVAVGHKLLDYRLDVHLSMDFRKIHGGIHFSDLEAGRLTQDESLYHDPILAEQALLVGGGVGYSVTNTLNATLGLRFFIDALSQNTLNASVLALGVSWTPR
jgi:hypothetical protein